MKYYLITINVILFYLKDQNTHKYYIVVIRFNLIFISKVKKQLNNKITIF